MQFLQREMAWSRVLSLETTVNRFEQELDKADADLFNAEEEMQRYAKAVVDADDFLKRTRVEWMELIERRVESERALGVSEYSLSFIKERIKELERMLDSSSEQRRRFDEAAIQLKARLEKGPTKLDDIFYSIHRF